MSPRPQPVPDKPPVLARMSLAVTRGKRRVPDKILMHGTEGVGKSKFASEAKAPIFLAAEEGVHHLDVAKFPQPETFDDALAALDVLLIEDHEYKTLVVDTADWLGFLIIDAVCKRNGWTPAQFDEYGRGFKVWTTDWRRFLAGCDRLNAKKGMEIILLSHSEVANFKNPAGADFMRYQPKIGGKEAPALLKEWAHNVLFAQHEEFTTDPKKGRVKGVATGQRVIQTQRTAAWDAKNRFDLAPVLPLEYAEYDAAREAWYADGIPQVNAAEVLAQCLALADQLELASDDKARKFIDENKNDTNALLKGLNRLRTLVAEKE